MRTVIFSLGIAGLAAAFAAVGNAQPIYGPPADYPQPGHMGAWVLSKLHQVNREEIHAGHLAVERGATREVRDYGQHLIDDHRDSDQHVMEVAQRLGIQLFDPQPRNDEEMRAAEEDHRMMDELEHAHGEHFDRLFSHMMDVDHTRVIHMLENMSDQIHSPEVRRLIDHTLPVLHQHRDWAQRIEQREGGGEGGYMPGP